MRGHEKRRWEKLKKGQNERKKRWRCNVQVDKMMLAQHQAGDLSKVYPTSDPMEAGPGFSIWIMRSLLLFSLFAFFLICCFSVLCSSRRRWTLPRVLSPFTFCQDTPNKLCRKGLSLAFFFQIPLSSEISDRQWYVQKHQIKSSYWQTKIICDNA